MSLFRILSWPVTFKGYVRRQLIALDQLFNTAAGGNPDETISSRLGVADAKGSGLADAACKVLDLAEKDHCAISVEFDANGNPDPHHMGTLIHELPPSTSRGTGPNVDKR